MTRNNDKNWPIRTDKASFSKLSRFQILIIVAIFVFLAVTLVLMMTHKGA